MSHHEKKPEPDRSRARRSLSIGPTTPERGRRSEAQASDAVAAWQQSLELLSITGDSRRSSEFTSGKPRVRPLYSPEERRRRDATAWTLVQGILAPVQFLIFLVSVALVLRFLLTGEGLAMATASVVAKTIALYTIMITGSIWEKRVFGRWLFAPAFFWEDVFSMLVLALHTAYLVALVTGGIEARGQMLLALAAYATYVVNATQFILKLRAARLQGRTQGELEQGGPAGLMAGAVS